MIPLTELERTDLRWMRKVNRRPGGIGLYGPTVRKLGPLDHCQSLVDQGLAILVGPGQGAKTGYWITKAGRAALREAEHSARSDSAKTPL